MKKRKYSAVLIDDEKPALEVLIYLIQKYCPQIVIGATFQHPEKAQKHIATHSPDLAFVDIRIGSTSGLELINNMKATTTSFIVTTAYSEYALEAWRTKALSYLMKPVDPEDLLIAFEKFVALKEAPESLSSARLNIGPESILSDSILYVSAEGSYSRLFLENKKEVLISRNLKRILELLNSSKFFRIHRSQIINLNHILSINEKNRIVTLKNKVECEISERRLSEFLAFLKQKKKKW
tara:strand:- start:2033 stop:2746 length:714 start_codon:yes stop_codon:yes gene_type:complete